MARLSAEERRIRETERQLREDYRAVLGTGAGQRLFAYILGEVTGVVPPRSIRPGTEAEMASAAGKQTIGHKLLMDIETYAPDAYLEIMTARVRKLKDDEDLRIAREREKRDANDD